MTVAPGAGSSVVLQSATQPFRPISPSPLPGWAANAWLRTVPSCGHGLSSAWLGSASDAASKETETQRDSDNMKTAQHFDSTIWDYLVMK